ARRSPPGSGSRKQPPSRARARFLVPRLGSMKSVAQMAKDERVEAEIRDEYHRVLVFNDNFSGDRSEPSLHHHEVVESRRALGCGSTLIVAPCPHILPEFTPVLAGILRVKQNYGASNFR